MNGVVGRADSVYITLCALAACSWKSEPLGSREAAHESWRKHIDGHAHADLVAYICANDTATVRYERQENRV